LSNFANDSRIRLARLKYAGGGDWYNDPSSEVNLLKFVRENTTLQVDAQYEFVDIKSENLFTYPLIFMTGHGSIEFSSEDAKKLRAYLENGGFLYVDDDYGMDEYFKKEIKKIFPDKELKEIPLDNPIFNIKYKFPKGVPKIHEHDDKKPETKGIFIDGKLVLLYTFESNPSDGWADPEVHNDKQEKREESLKFGTNVILYALTR
jgi:hypothetical protein